MSISKETKMARIIFILLMLLLFSPGVSMYIWMRIMTADEIHSADYYNISDYQIVKERNSPFWEVKNYKTVKKIQKKFSQERIFEDSIVFVYLYGYRAPDELWYEIRLDFFNTTGETLSVQLSDLRIKDAERTVVAAISDTLLDKSNAYKEHKRSKGSYYDHSWYTLNVRYEEIAIRDAKYFVTFKLNGRPFYDIIQRSEKIGFGSIV